MIAVLQQVMAHLGAAERAAAADFKYSQTQQALDELAAAVRSAKDQDDAEADRLWTDFMRAVKHNVNFFEERRRFTADANRIKNGADAALRQVQAQCQGGIAPHAGVPATLMGDARSWKQRANQVKGLQMEARQLEAIDGWVGASSGSYTTMAGVQVAALEELHGVMESTAQGCVAGAQLNQALFFIAAKAIRQCTSRIKSAPGQQGDTYYVRTATAWGELEGLYSQLNPVTTGKAATGSVASLATECVRTITMPNLLTHGSWPTGTSAAGVAPADTGGGVTNDGSTDLSAPDPTGGSCLPGVNL